MTSHGLISNHLVTNSRLAFKAVNTKLRYAVLVQIDEFVEDCLGSSHRATRLVTVQKVMVFCVFHDGDVSGRKEFAMAERDQKPVISTKEEILDGPRTASKLKAFWRQRCGVLSGKIPKLLQAVGEDFDILGRTSVTMLRVGFVTSFNPFLFSALFCKKNPDAASTNSSTGPATCGEAASVSALSPPFRHLVCRPIRYRFLFSIAPFILQFMLECRTESGDEVTLVQRPMYRGHKIIMFYNGCVDNISGCFHHGW